jgi:2',3'-cyclic-nucleotide 2'-phosphodiesterase (5'-nucleotidase family)
MDPSEGENVPLGHCHTTYIWEASNGVKIGFMGLAEREWAEKGNSLPQNLEYTEMIDAAEKIGPELREQGADIVIAMTHARQERDFRFGKGLPEGCVDMILAGHDHWWEHKIFDNGTHLVRSGSDFKMLSYITFWKKKDGKGRWDFEIVRRYVVRSIPEHKPTLEMTEKAMKRVRNRMERPIGYTITALDARNSTIKLKESNFANFVCDLMRLYHQTDVALMTGGTIKGDQVHTPGMVRLKFITESFPFEDSVVVIKVTGKALRTALENGVHNYPDEKEGKLFPGQTMALRNLLTNFRKHPTSSLRTLILVQPQ